MEGQVARAQVITGKLRTKRKDEQVAGGQVMKVNNIKYIYIRYFRFPGARGEFFSRFCTSPGKIR